MAPTPMLTLYSMHSTEDNLQPHEYPRAVVTTHRPLCMALFDDEDGTAFSVYPARPASQDIHGNAESVIHIHPPVGKFTSPGGQELDLYIVPTAVGRLPPGTTILTGGTRPEPWNPGSSVRHESRESLPVVQQQTETTSGQQYQQQLSCRQSSHCRFPFRILTRTRGGAHDDQSQSQSSSTLGSRMPGLTSTSSDSPLPLSSSSRPHHLRHGRHTFDTTSQDTTDHHIDEPATFRAHFRAWNRILEQEIENLQTMLRNRGQERHSSSNLLRTTTQEYPGGRSPSPATQSSAALSEDSPVSSRPASRPTRLTSNATDDHNLRAGQEVEAALTHSFSALRQAIADRLNAYTGQIQAPGPRRALTTGYAGDGGAADQSRNDELCPICQDELSRSTPVQRCPECHTAFHPHCIGHERARMPARFRCPTCRCPLSPEGIQ